MNFNKIMVNRKSDVIDSHMITLAITGLIQPRKCYQISNENLIEVKCISEKKLLIKQSSNTIPNSVQINNIKHKWQDTNKEKSNGSNILGKNGTLDLDSNNLNIPLIETTEHNLSFYGAIIVKMNDVVSFDIPVVLPITKMNIGKNYFETYLLNESNGGGCYLEYHDTPHFHMPLDNDASGSLILGKIVDNVCHLSAFKIPYGYAIYTPPYTIHCDGNLVGDYLVVYTITEKYSTVLIKNNNKPVRVHIV